MRMILVIPDESAFRGQATCLQRLDGLSLGEKSEKLQYISVIGRAYLSEGFSLRQLLVDIFGEVFVGFEQAVSHCDGVESERVEAVVYEWTVLGGVGLALLKSWGFVFHLGSNQLFVVTCPETLGLG